MPIPGTGRLMGFLAGRAAILIGESEETAKLVEHDVRLKLGLMMIDPLEIIDTISNIADAATDVANTAADVADSAVDATIDVFETDEAREELIRRTVKYTSDKYGH